MLPIVNPRVIITKWNSDNANKSMVKRKWNSKAHLKGQKKKTEKEEISDSTYINK